MSNWAIQICCKDGKCVYGEFEARDREEILIKLQLEKGNDYIYLIDKEEDFVFIPKSEITRINAVQIKKIYKELKIEDLGYGDEEGDKW